MRSRIPRRDFLRHAVAAPAALVAGFDPDGRKWIADGRAASGPFARLPRLHGRLLFDAPTLATAALDNGNIVHRTPKAVLQAASADDVVAMVRFATQHGLRIAMRGQGHSVYGQAQVEAGIVVDSTTLGRVLRVDGDIVEAEAGATWAAINEVTLSRGLTPRVTPDTTNLTVGGGASVGTWGHTSHRFGGLVDNVTALDVVTGDGRLVSCSADRDSELFEMVLGGLGQCALIVRARVRLTRAPERVRRQHLLYEDLDAFYADQERLMGRVDHLEGRFLPDAAKRWRPRIDLAVFSGDDSALAQARDGLRFLSAEPPTRLTFAEYLGRRAYVPQPESPAERDRMRASRRNPSIVMWLPRASAQPIVEDALAAASALTTPWAFTSTVMDTTLFRRPLFRMPDGRLAISLWLLRSVPASDERGFNALMSSSRSFMDRMRAAGGKRYPPYGLVASSSEWQEHYGPDVWPRFLRAKQRFDPNHVLTPGPGFFEPSATSA
jgi:cytokinin dehydrogenase